MGRTGKWWSIQHFGIEPDLMSVGKSLASGMPLSAMIGRKEILESLGAPANVYTTAGNPVTTAEYDNNDQYILILVILRAFHSK